MNFRIVFPLSFILFTIWLKAESQNDNENCLKTFQNKYENSDDNTALNVVDAGNGQFYVAANSISNNSSDILITKHNADGSILWSKKYGAAGDETVRRIKLASDGGLLIIGQTRSFTNSNGDILCLKISSAGQMIWSRKFGVGSTFGDLGMDIIQTTDNSYVFTGILNVTGTLADMLVVKLDNNANILWSQRFDSEQGENGVGVLQKGDTLIVTSDIDNNTSDFNGLISKIKLSDGKLLFTKKIRPGSRNLYNSCVFKDNADGYWISGHTIDQTSYANMQQILLHFDVNFKLTQTYKLDLKNNIYTNDYYTGFAVRPDGFLTCAGSASNPAGYLFYIKNDGSIKMAKKFSGVTGRELYGLLNTNGKIICVGKERSSVKNNLFIAEFGDDGFVDEKCHPDTALLTVTNPAYTITDLNWKTIKDQQFADITAPLSTTNVSFTASSLCDACEIAITPSFTTPDTVCVNSPVKITNTTKGATNYYWNFCTADINQPPVGDNLGNVGNLMNRAVYIDYVYENGKYYGFMTNNYPGKLMRLEFGNSLLNTPVVTDLGTLNGIIPTTDEGIQIIKNEDKWYLIIVGGDPQSTGSYIVKVELGANIANNNPTVVNWGNIGNLAYPHDLYTFQDNGVWYGVTVNTSNNTITRFNFTNSLDNIPTADNLGNLGNLDGPTGLHAINDNGSWYVFVTNALSSTLTRLDFGNSLLNTPKGYNLGNPGNLFHTSWDISIIKYCGNISGFVINADQQYNNLIRLDFSTISAIPSTTDYGNVGNMLFPHCLSKIFRAGADVYTFVPNVENNTLTRLRFSGCTNSSVPNSSAQNPPDVTYNKPGIYNINLSVDDGLPTQSSYCRQVVVLPSPEKKPTIDTSFCQGDSIVLKAQSAIGTYTWNTGSAYSSIDVKNAGTYWVDINYYGCKVRDSIVTSLKAAPHVFLGNDTAICKQDDLVLDAGKDGIEYLWQDNSTTETYLVKTPGLYSVVVTNQAGCQSKDSIKITSPNNSLDFTYKQDVCSPLTMKFSIDATVEGSFEWFFGDGATNSSDLNPVQKYKDYGIYKVILKVASKGCIDSITKQINLKITSDNTTILTDDTTICKGNSVKLKALDNLSYCWSPSYNISDANSSSPVVSPDTTTVYYLYALGEENNLIVNGDFSQGNVGFSSGYNYANNNTVEGQYTVGASPYSWNNGMSSCTDHTGQASNGNMLMVNGAPDIDVNVWTETMSVLPNTDYAFSTWIQTISPLQNPAQLQFSINGKLIGNIFKSNDAGCIWSKFYELWNSGSSTTAVISIVNKNSIRWGNDFALDDIFFAPTSIRRDSVKVIVIQKPVVNIGADTSICSHDILMLHAGEDGSIYMWQDGTKTETYQVKLPGVYSVTVTNQAGCQNTDSVRIDSLESPVVFLKDTSICIGNTIMLNAQSAGNNSYQWQPSPTLSAINIFNPVAAPLDTSMYFVTVSNTSNCRTKDSITVSVVSKPTVKAMADTSLCYGSTFTLSAAGTNTNYYHWSPSQGLNDVTLQNPSGTLLVDTITYTVTAYNDGCAVNDNVKLTAMPLPALSLAYKDTTICVGGRANLSVSGNGNFVWSPAMAIDDTLSASPIVTPVASTLYHVQVTDANSCTNSDSVFVAVNPKPIFAINPKQPSICIGDSVLITASGGDVYTWSPATSVRYPYSASSVVFPSESTVYEVTVTNNSCHVTDSLFASVTVTTKPEITITKSNDIDCFIGSAKLEATGGSKFLWSPAATLSNTYGYTTVARPTETTTYYVEVTKNGSCKATDSIQVKVIKDGAQNGYFVPTAFTPNGDMRNDCFGVKNWGVVTNFDFSVYNRWGERIFYTRNASDCWNGMYKNTLQPPGAYVYQIRAKTLCGDVYRKGTIVLIR